MRSSFNTESVVLGSVCAVADGVDDELPLLTDTSGTLSACTDSAFVSSLARLSNPDGSSNRSLIVCCNKQCQVAALLKSGYNLFLNNMCELQ